MSDALQLSPEESRFQNRMQRIRRLAKTVSRLLGPFVILAVAAWFVFTGAVCWGGDPIWLEIFLCRNAYVLPGIAATLMYVGVTWLLLELAGFFASQIGADGSEIPNYLRSKHSDIPHRMTNAFEMTGWATATLIGILIFRYSERGWPLGMLAILGITRGVLMFVKAVSRTYNARPRDPDARGPPAPAAG